MLAFFLRVSSDLRSISVWCGVRILPSPLQPPDAPCPRCSTARQTCVHAEGPILSAPHLPSQALRNPVAPRLIRASGPQVTSSPRNAIPTVATGWQHVRTDHTPLLSQRVHCRSVPLRKQVPSRTLSDLVCEKAAPPHLDASNKAARPGLAPGARGDQPSPPQAVLLPASTPH